MDTNFNDSDFAAMIGEMEKENQKGTGKSLYWKPTSEGTTNIRIITPLKQFGEKLFYEKHRMHYINGRSIFCLNQTLKDKDGNVHEAEPCPICAKVKQLYNNGQKGSEEWRLAGDLRARDRYVSRIIVRGKKDADGKDDETRPEFWEFGMKIHEYFFNQIKLGQAGNFLSLKDGRDYLLTKKGTGRNTDYSASCLSMQQSPVFADVEKLKKLMEYLPSMDYSQLVEFKNANEILSELNIYLNGGETNESAFTSAPVESQVDPLDAMTQPVVNVAPATTSSEPKEDIDALLGMI